MGEHGLQTDARNTARPRSPARMGIPAAPLNRPADRRSTRPHATTGRSGSCGSGPGTAHVS